MDCISFTASKVSLPVLLRALSSVDAYMLSKVVAPSVSDTLNWLRSLMARASFRPRNVLASDDPRLTARTGDFRRSADGGSARFNQPSLVAFRPGVPDSM